MGYAIYIQTPDGKDAEGDENYFCFASTAMPRTLDAMTNFGMLVDLPIPTFPKLSEYQLKRADFLPRTEPDKDIAGRVAAYRAAYLAVKDASEPEPTGIPAYKLEHNDGYLVTVAEITAALTNYEANANVDIAEMPVGDLTWPTWTAFLRRAKSLGGLRTY
ncbi:hypothetical protein [Streptomyces flavofungini]|uniref:hypothetical protein n=1 Tax=Streptomyces flavofungini TaxID=68200 RepID=UPI0025B0BA8E|nr:hypothetical protein [Streptomyces flavofungini]WJV48928.1 hypothetical protein QUY26_27475 [Streptomyces flavofungini]